MSTLHLVLGGQLQAALNGRSSLPFTDCGEGSFGTNCHNIRLGMKEGTADAGMWRKKKQRLEERDKSSNIVIENRETGRKG